MAVLNQCNCASEMCRRFGCQKDAQLLREYQAEKAKLRIVVGQKPVPMPMEEPMEDIVRRVLREELARHFGPRGE